MAPRGADAGCDFLTPTRRDIYMRSPLCSFREGLKEKGEKKKVIFFLGGGGETARLPRAWFWGMGRLSSLGEAL